MKRVIKVRNIQARVELVDDAEVALREASPGPGAAVTSFWEGKSPCWQMSHCPPQIYEECPAYRNTAFPCWEVEGTYCKLTMEGGHARGRDTAICQVCRVYKKYSAGKTIEIRLTGLGIDTALNAAQEKAEARP